MLITQLEALYGIISSTNDIRAFVSKQLIYAVWRSWRLTLKVPSTARTEQA